MKASRGGEAGSAPPARGLGGPWPIVVALGLGVFVGGFDQTFVVPVLARILDDFAIPIDRFGRSSWIINGYLLGYTVAMPLMGRVADVYGHFRVFVVALLIFMGGSVLVALSPNLPAMAAARALTALGGGALVPVALAIAADALPGRQRAIGVSTVSVLDDASSLLGPVWGTLIGVWLGWRGLFWMNIVLGMPVLLAVLFLARESPPRRAQSVDWVGGLLLAGVLASITVALAGDGSGGWPWFEFVGLTATAVMLAIVFGLWELRVGAPLFDLRGMRDRRLLLAFVLFFFEGAALITALVNIPLMAEVLWDRTGAGPGLVLMRMVLFMIPGGLLGAVLMSWVGARATVSAGFGLAAVGLAGMWAWPEVPRDAVVWSTLAVAGVGFTLGDAPIYMTVIESVEVSRRASMAALLQVLQSAGMIVGMALLATEGLGRFDERAARVFATAPGETEASVYRAVIHQTFDETFAAAAVLMAVAAVIAMLLRPGAHEEPPGR